MLGLPKPRQVMLRKWDPGERKTQHSTGGSSAEQVVARRDPTPLYAKGSWLLKTGHDF